MYNKKQQENVYLVDATGFVLKYWFVMPKIKTENYESISAFLGFCPFFLKLLSDISPKYILCAFDESLGTCFRNKIFPDYKKNRENAPEELKTQFNLCRNFLNLLGINNLASNKYEEYDINNTISVKPKFHPIICSRRRNVMNLMSLFCIDFSRMSIFFIYKKIAYIVPFLLDFPLLRSCVRRRPSTFFI